MNKTISINLGGIVFIVEEQAYDKLNLYLKSLEQHFANDEGKEEIVSDIEGRLAELFHETLALTNSQVVTDLEVDEAIGVMGLPEDFGDGNADLITNNPTTANNTNTANNGNNKTQRRFFRNPDDKIFGGVCSGICAYFGIVNPVWLRLTLVLGVFLSWGILIPIYILLWMIVPAAQTASDKLAMKGENATVSNIEKTVKDSLNGVGDSINNISNTQSGTKLRNGISRGVEWSLDVLQRFGKFLGNVFRVGGTGLAFILVFSLGITLFALLFAGVEIVPFLSNTVFESSAMLGLTSISVLMLIGIPFLALSYLLISLLFKVSMPNAYKVGAAMGIVWLLSIGLGMIPAIKESQNFRREGRVEQVVALDNPIGDVLYLDLLNDGYFEEVQDNKGVVSMDFDITYDDTHILGQTIGLKIEKSETGQFELVKEMESKGRTTNQAKALAENINYRFEQSDSVLRFEPHFAVPKSDKFRVQDLGLTLKVPEGKSVHFDKNLLKILRDAENVSKTRRRNMSGLTWTMLPEGLSCLDCENITLASNKTTNNTSISAVTSGAARAFVPRGEHTEVYDITNFDDIAVTGHFYINILKGDEYSVKLVGDKKAIDKVEVSKSGDLLLLEQENNNSLFGIGNFGKNKMNVYINITMPDLEEVSMSGASEAIISGFEEDNLEMYISGSNNVEFYGNVEDFNLETAGVVNIELVGIGKNLTAIVSGAGNVSAFDYIVDEVEMEVAGAAKVEVFVQNTLDIELAGAASLEYKGNPNNVMTDIAGAGQIQQAN